MKKSAILFGSPESVHMQRFISLLLNKDDGFERIVVFSISKSEKMKEPDIEFYRKRNINILCVEPKKYSNRIFGGIVNYLRRRRYLSKYLREHGGLDYCFIHFCAWQNAKWVSSTKRYYKQIIPVFWGGDILRNNYLNSCVYRRFLDASSHIILPNTNSYKVFDKKTSGKYQSKTYTIQFPNGVCERMIKQKETIDKLEARKEFGFPISQRIVICGHTATRAEQYENIIIQLEKCNSATIEQCCFVFFMTYAPDDYRTYQEEIEHKLMKTKLHYIVLKEFIQQDDMVKMHYAADIHITMIRTDAFSCFLQEELMAGNVLLYGKWLNYFEIENSNFFSFPIESFNDIPKVLDDVVLNYDKYAELSQINSQNLIRLKSNDSIKKIWTAKIFK